MTLRLAGLFVQLSPWEPLARLLVLEKTLLMLLDTYNFQAGFIHLNVIL